MSFYLCDLNARYIFFNTSVCICLLKHSSVKVYLQIGGYVVGFADYIGSGITKSGGMEGKDGKYLAAAKFLVVK